MTENTAYVYKRWNPTALSSADELCDLGQVPSLLWALVAAYSLLPQLLAFLCPAPTPALVHTHPSLALGLTSPRLPPPLQLSQGYSGDPFSVIPQHAGTP